MSPSGMRSVAGGATKGNPRARGPPGLAEATCAMALAPTRVWVAALREWATDAWGQQGAKFPVKVCNTSLWGSQSLNRA